MKAKCLRTPVALFAALLLNLFSVAHAQNLEKLNAGDRAKVEKAWQVIEEFTRSDDFPEQVNAERLKKLYKETIFVRGYPPMALVPHAEEMTQREWERELRVSGTAACTIECTIYFFPHTYLANQDVATALVFHEMMHRYFGGHVSDGSPQATLLLFSEEWLAYDFEIQLMEWIVDEYNLGLFNEFKRYRAIQRIIKHAKLIRDFYLEAIERLEKELAEIASGISGSSNAASNL